MPIPAVLATVPKTGSHFMLGLLGDGFTADDAALEHALKRGRWAGLFRHTFPENMAQLERWKGRIPIIAPMRDPADVMRGWIKRSNEDGLPWGGLDGFVRTFERLFSLNPFIIAIDAPDRDQRLRELRAWIGRDDLETDWTPVNACDKPVRPFTRPELCAIAHVRAHPKMIARGYAQKRAA